MLDQVKKYWLNLQPRERLIVGWGSIIVLLIMLYLLLFQPWYQAVSHMQEVLPAKRAELVWMRQQQDLLNAGGVAPTREIKGQGESLMAVIEKTARNYGVRDTIKQLVPRQGGREVSVVLEQVSFNKWVRWVDNLSSQYSVNAIQLTAEREDDKADTAEIRVTFAR